MTVTNELQTPSLESNHDEGVDSESLRETHFILASTIPLTQENDPQIQNDAVCDRMSKNVDDDKNSTIHTKMTEMAAEKKVTIEEDYFLNRYNSNKSYLVSKSNFHKGRSRSIQTFLYRMYDQGESLLDYQRNDLGHIVFTEENQPLAPYSTEKKRSNSVDNKVPIITNGDDEEKISENDCIFKDSEMIKKDEEVEFFSKFESGNLERVWKYPQVDSTKYKAHYYLGMHYDNKTANHSQWFYFGVKGLRAGETYRFSLVNCIKGNRSMFREGMKICVYSELENAKTSQGWIRDGTNIQYYQNNYVRPETANKKFWTLEFTFTPKLDGDTIYFTQAVPYTYTYLQNYLQELEGKLSDSKDIFFHRELLCHTVASNRCELLTITSRVDGKSSELDTDKPCIFLSSRVHPGEVQGSHMMHGTIQFLTSDNPVAQYLRLKYIFKIVPMLNPDGVRVGNYRTNLQGIDLNRTWQDPDIDLHPAIFHTKNLIGEINSTRKISLFMDYHGHSRKKNIFIYGCSSKDRDRMLKIRVYPKILSERSELSYKYCQFNLLKKGAARCAVYLSFDIIWSFTIEASLCGPLDREVHYGTGDYNRMGEDIVKILQVCENDEETKRVYQILSEIVPEKKAPAKRPIISRLEKRLGKSDPKFIANRSNDIEIHVSPRSFSAESIDNSESNTSTSSLSQVTSKDLHKSSLDEAKHSIEVLDEEDSMTTTKAGASWIITDIPKPKRRLLKKKKSTIQKSASSQLVSPPTQSTTLDKGVMATLENSPTSIVTYQSLMASSIILLILRILVKILLGF